MSVIANRNYNNGCPYCAGKHPTEDNNLLIKNGFLCEEWNYKKNNTSPENFTPCSSQKVWWVCKECGNEWLSTISHRNNGRGCPECNASKGEKQIKKILDNLGFILINHKDYSNFIHNNKYQYYVRQKKFDGFVGLGGCNLSYDFYLPQYNLLIEYQGEQHEKPVDFNGLGLEVAKKKFKMQLKHDRRKREYSNNNNINLLEIWYWDFDKIEEILENFFQINNINIAV